MLPTLIAYRPVSLSRGLRNTAALSANKDLSNDVHMIFMFCATAQPCSRDFLGTWIRTEADLVEVSPTS